MKRYYIFVLFLCVVSVPNLVHGATFYFDRLSEFPSNDNGQLVLTLQTGGEIINAVSGKIDIPENVDISRITLGSSAILLWLEKPKIGRTIIFSGITPGGFQGNVELLRFTFTKKGTQDVLFQVTEAEASKNDGKGSPVAVSSKPFVFGVSPGPGNQIVEKDTIPPEEFGIVLGRDSRAFDGSYFVSFATQDKGVGVERSLWAHTWFFEPDPDDWIVTESPIVLTKSSYFQKLFVKAVDFDGNERVSVLYGPFRYVLLVIGIIIILTLCALFYFARRSLFRFS